MKKKLSFVLALAFIITLTGCGEKKITCTNQQSFGVTVLDTETVVTLKKDYVKRIDTTMKVEFQDEDTAESFADNYRDDEDVTVEVDGTKVIVKNKEEFKSDETKKTKEEVKESLEGRGYTCK